METRLERTAYDAVCGGGLGGTGDLRGASRVQERSDSLVTRINTVRKPDTARKIDDDFSEGPDFWP